MATENPPTSCEGRVLICMRAKRSQRINSRRRMRWLFLLSPTTDAKGSNGSTSSRGARHHTRVLILTIGISSGDRSQEVTSTARGHLMESGGNSRALNTVAEPAKEVILNRYFTALLSAAYL